MSVARGWQFFMHPGPTNIPLRVLHAMARPAVDFTGPEFVALRDRSLERLKGVLKTRQGFVIAYAASGHGAWDASIANLFSPGDRVLVCQAGYFSENWATTARQYGLEVEVVQAPERRAVDPNAVAERLAADRSHAIKAVMMVQNETATGMRHPVAEVRAAMNRVRHPALYLVDTISSLASYDFRMDEWGVDLAIGGSQKGLMLPPGMSFTAINARAWEASRVARNPRRYWDWRTMVEDDHQVRFCGTAPIAFFYGLDASLDMIEEEGLENVFARHRRLAQATRACVRAWGAVSAHGGGPEIYSLDPEAASDSLTAVLTPQGHDADRVRAIAAEKYGVGLGRGLGALQGRVFRIGHMGDLNEPMLLGALGAIELALAEAGMPHARGGVVAAMDALRAPTTARMAAVA
ncbi:MAG TPA: aminotransferase class V-fold PLP-dependent enzyme [Burkholderiales bacterium]|nr:aminotransferase class V-fold PLP-dependent enzyme [Burkholderiales bacterium]